MIAQTVINTQIQAQRLSIRELESLRNCERRYFLEKTGISYSGLQSRAFMREVILEQMKKMLYQKEKKMIPKITKLFKEGYQKSWFDCEPQWESSMERDLSRVLRLLNFIVENQYETEMINIPYQYQFPDGFCYKNYYISEIAGNIDILFRKGEERFLINFANGEPKYSYAPRTEEKGVAYSMELLLMHLGTVNRYDFVAVPQLWHLKSKDDKGDFLTGIFECRKGKNIISCNYREIPDETILQLLEKNLLPKERDPKSCSNCIHRNICNLNSQIRQETEVEYQEPMKRTVNYTKEQLKVVNHKNGPLAVLAVPGAGKTASLVGRMEKLIQSGVKPGQILFVTFTKKAAKEIKERVGATLQQNGVKGMPDISTYHSLGFSILKNNPMYLGNRVKLATETDRLGLIWKAIITSPRILKVSYDGIYTEFGLIRQLEYQFEEIDKIGERQFTALYEEKKDTKGILHAYHTYKRMYDKAGYISFDMQISLVNELFEKYPVLARKYANRYKYIMLDEFQDTSEEQATMIYEIARFHNNIVVVGDDDQSVYTWRGGSKEFLLNFQYDFPEAAMVTMNDNFRSNAPILAASEALISGNHNRFQKKLISHLPQGSKPIYLKGYDKSYLRVLIKTAITRGSTPGEIAILARNNSALKEVQDVLEGEVPITTPKDFIIEDTVFRMIFDVLQLYYSSLNEDESFYRFFAYQGSESLRKDKASNSFYQDLLVKRLILPAGTEDECIQAYANTTLKNEYVPVMKKLMECFQIIKYGNVLKEILKDLFLVITGLPSHRVIDVLCEIADEKGVVTAKELYLLMRNMITFRETTRVGYEVSPDAVNLLTCHDAKGKEFPTVIIFGMEDFGEEEEEICVLYVAMTRAMKNLFLFENPYNHCKVFNRFQSLVVVKGADSYD